VLAGDPDERLADVERCHVVAGARDFNRAESRSGGELEHVAPARSPAGDGARDQVTPDGRRMLDVWMRTVLAVPAREFPDFPAALSLVAAAEPGEVRALLSSSRCRVCRACSCSRMNTWPPSCARKSRGSAR